MELVLTLIGDPNHAGLTEAVMEETRRALANGGVESEAPDWLAEGIACDLSTDGELETVRDAARSVAANTSHDIIIQPSAGRRKKLLLADMDSTIVTSETLDELAEHAGLKEQIAAITARAMRGELDFEEALRERVGMLKGLAETALEETWRKVELTPGAKALVGTMRTNGARCVLVSGGFRFFTDRVAETVGFHENHANSLIVEDGKLTGDVATPILDKDAKLSTLERILAEEKLARSESMTVGDGANDLPMILAAGLGVAYHAKPLVEAEAPACVRHGDLTALLYMQGYRRNEFTG